MFVYTSGVVYILLNILYYIFIYYL